MKLDEFCAQEIRLLREELHQLKSCQITFLTLAVTGTGAILGFAMTASPPDLRNMAFLAPLALLLPFWWIFFDKAITITRIVGYYRILEKVILGNYRSVRVVGWENALTLFREKDRAKSLRKIERTSCPDMPFRLINRVARGIPLFFLWTSHRYWVICYHTFLVLSLICLVLSARGMGVFAGRIAASLSDLVLLALAAVLFVLAAFWNARVVVRLILGPHSYDCNERIWKHILEYTEASTAAADDNQHGAHLD